MNLRPKGHHYPVYVIQIAILLLIDGLNSLRGIEKTFEIFSQFLFLSTPDFSSIRQWGLRLGLYELQRPKEYRTDWIFIIDMTIELGAAKCLVILGISQNKFKQIINQEARGLQHHDVEVLALEILEKTSGNIIAEKLKDLAKRVGAPIQILSDWGSDIKKGIDLYKQDNSRVITTYDITHKMANLLKHELSQDERYQNFLRECSLTRQRVQQTKLYFLIPPKQRTKARYYNVDILIDWAKKVCQYEEDQDFSQISTTYHLDNEALLLLSSTLNADILISIGCLKPQVYENSRQFSQALLNHLGQDLWQLHGEFICQCADLGRRKFYDKFGWLSSYQLDIQTYAEMLTLIQSVQIQLKTQGLHQLSPEQWSYTSADYFSPRVQKLQQQILKYLTFESRQVPDGETLLGTSDVIESLFGKYKFFAAKRPLKDISTSILLIPLSTLKITTQLVKRAMETIRSLDVRSWSQSVFGSSMLSHRRSLRVVTTSDTEVA